MTIRLIVTAVFSEDLECPVCSDGHEVTGVCGNHQVSCPGVGWTVVPEKVHFEELPGIISFSWWFRWIVAMFSVTKDGVLGF